MNACEASEIFQIFPAHFGLDCTIKSRTVSEKEAVPEGAIAARLD